VHHWDDGITDLPQKALVVQLSSDPENVLILCHVCQSVVATDVLRRLINDAMIEYVSQKTKKETGWLWWDDNLIEQLASLAHKQWSGWMTYLFDKCASGPHGNVIIPPVLVDRWKRQKETEYALLPEEEKESDRHEARRVIEVLNNKWQPK